MSGSSAEGLVVAVCMSPNHGFPTYPQEGVFIGEWGIEGDAHSGEIRESFTNPGTFKPNDRPISIVADEVRLEMNNRFGINMQPGDFSEQVLVRGLGDLSDVKVGSRVLFASGVRLEVVDKATPCARLEAYNNAPGMKGALLIKNSGEKLLSRRGILTKVLEVGDVIPGMGVILQPAETNNEKA